MSDVAIHYRRPPDRSTVFRQRLVHRTADCIITLMERAGVAEPLTVRGRPILEPESPVVWFTFPDAWHDIGRFHTADGAFTGHYANILTPVRFWSELEWDTTDLFLDVWRSADGVVDLLDEAEFVDAVNRGWVQHTAAASAQREAARLLAAAQAGTWPPAITHEWTVERARATGHTA